MSQMALELIRRAKADNCGSTIAAHNAFLEILICLKNE